MIGKFPHAHIYTQQTCCTPLVGGLPRFSSFVLLTLAWQPRYDRVSARAGTPSHHLPDLIKKRFKQKQTRLQKVSPKNKPQLGQIAKKVHAPTNALYFPVYAYMYVCRRACIYACVHVCARASSRSFSFRAVAMQLWCWQFCRLRRTLWMRNMHCKNFLSGYVDL